jgi:hypothetical protein
VHVQQFLNEDKSKHVGLAQQNDFGPLVLFMVWRLAKGKSKPNTYCWSTRWLGICKILFQEKKGGNKRNEDKKKQNNVMVWTNQPLARFVMIHCLA